MAEPSVAFILSVVAFFFADRPIFTVIFVTTIGFGFVGAAAIMWDRYRRKSPRFSETKPRSWLWRPPNHWSQVADWVHEAASYTFK